LPFLNDRAKPWLLHSFLPAVYETLIALKDRLFDLLSTPSEEVKTARADRKRRRREATEARAAWKRRGDKAAKKWSHAWKEIDADSGATSSSSEATASDAINAAATLTNRATKQTRDSSLEKAPKHIDASESTLDPAAPAFEPLAAKQDEAPMYVISKPAGIEHEAGLPLKSDVPAAANVTDKLAPEGGQKDDVWINEPRSGGLNEPIQ